MRGILLLLAGAALIYLGFKGSDTDESTTLSGDPPIQNWQDESTSSTEHSQPEQPITGGSDVGSPPQETAPTDPNPPLEPELAPESESASVPPVPEPEAQPRFELVGASADPVELASLLLDAWISQDPTSLGKYMNGEEGGTLTPARRTMVAAFWQSMAGKGDEAQKTLVELDGAEGVTSSELALLGIAVEPPASRVLAASRSRRGALERAMQMILLEVDSSNALAEGRLPAAAVGYSHLIHAEIEAPWPAHREALTAWSAALRKSQGAHRLSKSGDWPSIEVEVKDGETLTHIRKRALAEQEGMIVCTGLIERVNEVKRYIHPKDRLRVPTSRPNVLVDLSARLVVYRHGEEAVLCFPCGIGREGKETPPGVFLIGDKVEEPIWYREDGPPVPYGDPENALGDRWLEWRLDGQKTSFGFHGTNDPNGVGSRVSRGCIRLKNADVRELFELLPVGAEIVVQP